jgi:outer membrane lipoprotein LolB
VKVLTKAIQTATAMRTLCLLGLITALAGCASTPAAKPAPDAAALTLRQQHLQSLGQIQQFSLQGRIGVQTNGKGFSGSMQWLHNKTDDSIALFSPLGSQVASIKKTPDQFTLEDASGKSYTAADAETLTQEILGWRLPLKGLADWSVGRPTQSPVQNSLWNEQGALTHLEQDGWKIEYSNYQQQGSYLLPNKIYLKSEQLNLKLLVEKWNQLEH